MTILTVRGGIGALAVKTDVPGAKNSALPILAAAAVAPGPVEVANVPRIADVAHLLAIFRGLGLRDHERSGALKLSGAGPAEPAISPELSSRLRGSVYALAVLAVRAGGGTIGPIGGDLLADSGRRADLAPHVRMFDGLGMSLTRTPAGWRLDGRLRPGEFAIHDNGITASAMGAIIAATLPGRSVIRAASPEIEVDDVLGVLRELGAEADRDGSALVVAGPMTSPARPLMVPPDRLYAGTLAIAAAATGGAAELDRCLVDRMAGVLEAIAAFGVRVERTESDGVRVAGAPTRGAYVRADLYPAVPSDLLPLFTVLATQAPGKSVIEDAVYYARDGHVSGLLELGAFIERSANRLVVVGPTRWRPAEVAVAGIRETCALYLAALLAPGTSVIRDASAMDRGYEGLREYIDAQRPDTL